MLPTSRIMLAMILAVVVQYVDGNQRIVHVSDSITSGEDDNSHILCCVYGNCSCNSLDHALANLTSNVLINITTDVMLSSLVRASDLENVTIFGHNDPTVNCKHVGGIHFTFCNNCIIQGITWDGCGTENFDNHTEPGLLFNYSSNVIIEKCSFQHLVGQAVVLLEMSGDVNINDCKFINNSHYRGHGAAIHYSSNNTRNPPQLVLFVINNCFSYNKMKSLVYLENRSFKCNKMIFNNSTFYRNQGTSVYAINHKFYLNGKVLFQNNTAENGAGIYISDHSTVIFGKNSDVTFIQNSANYKGAAIFLSNRSSIICDQSSKVTFNNNSATNGTVYSEVSSNVTFKANCCVTFSGNSATQRGAAIYSDSSRVTFTGNSNAAFSSNYANDNIRFFRTYGGSIYSINFSKVSFEESSTTVFSNNTADYGGNICSFDHGHILFEGNSNTLFNNNAAYKGGAIYHRNYGSILFKGNATTMFSNNTAYFGGAIESLINVSISFSGNSVAMFTDNTANYGGAISSIRYGNTSFEGNSTTVFNNNSAIHGGAIYTYNYGSTFFEGNSITVFNNNIADRYGYGYGNGGAVYSQHGYISFGGNSTTGFNNNTSDRGGAIYSYYYSSMSFEGNSATLVLFNNNIADRGGAIYSNYYCNISFEGNSTTLFNNNNADQGGAIYSNYHGSYISFEGKSTTLFNNNTADQGGAIFSASYYYSSYISFKGNSSTAFRNNTAYNKGGAMMLANAQLTFDDYSMVSFTSNKATIDATIFSTGESDQVMEIGSPTVIFNDHTVNWCNITCSSDANRTDHQTDEDFVITIYSSGTVSCISEQNTFVSLNRKCGSKYLKDILVTLTSNGSVIISDIVIISSVIFLTKLDNISIIAHKNHSIMCVNNAGLQVEQCSNITIKGVDWSGCGAYSTPVINIFKSSDVTLQNCLFEQSKAQAVVIFELSGDVRINQCRFINNTDYRGHGAAIHYSSNDKTNASNASQITIVISNCNFTQNEGDRTNSLVYINAQTEDSDTNIILSNSFFHNNYGKSVYLSNHTLHINGEVLFENNVADYGAGIHISYFSKVIFDKNANVKFTNNSVYRNGAAIILNDHSSVSFDQNSVVAFNGNKATRGTIYSEVSSNVTFNANCQVTFTSNSAILYGAAIYSSDNSHVTFTGYSNIKFNNHVASTYIRQGGTVHSEHFSSISFEENSTVVFYNNTGYNGGAICDPA